MTRVKPDPVSLPRPAHSPEGAEAAGRPAAEGPGVAPGRKLPQEEFGRFLPDPEGLGELPGACGPGEEGEGFLDHGRLLEAAKARR